MHYLSEYIFWVWYSEDIDNIEDKDVMSNYGFM